MPKTKIQVFNYCLNAKNDSEVDVYVDGEIVDASTQEILRDWFGDETSTSYKSFRNQIDSLNPKILNVWVNSPGGHVGDAMAMHDYLDNLEKNGVVINRIGRGIIASAGTYLMMGNNSTMTANSMMMIHNIQMFAYGDIEVVENEVKIGRKFNNLVRDFYSKQTGQAPETISKWMNNETWFNANEAFEKGFIKNKPTTSSSFTNYIPEDKFPYLNKVILNTYNSNIKTHNMPDNFEQKIENAFTKVLNALGFTNKKDDKVTQDAIADFTNEIKEVVNSNITEDKVKEIVQNAIKEIKPLDTSNFATKEDIKTVDTSNFATKDDIKNLVTTKNLSDLKDEIIDGKINKAGKETDADNGSGGGKRKNLLNTKVKNKFSGISYEDVTV